MAMQTLGLPDVGMSCADTIEQGLAAAPMERLGVEIAAAIAPAQQSADGGKTPMYATVDRQIAGWCPRRSGRARWLVRSTRPAGGM
jgi:hypothetical protein